MFTLSLNEQLSDTLNYLFTIIFRTWNMFQNNVVIPCKFIIYYFGVN